MIHHFDTKRKKLLIAPLEQLTVFKVYPALTGSKIPVKAIKILRDQLPVKARL